MNNSLESRESASTFKAMHVVRKMKLENVRKFLKKVLENDTRLKMG